ncbi:MAG: GDSL-type esterase/lipase family protein [Candidatus Omnitrophota bacterium]|nr:GDSL-type esterase/lipase family protein [Candidatus Omnitrophota bacterium]
MKIIRKSLYFLTGALLTLVTIEIALQFASLILSYKLNKQFMSSESIAMHSRDGSLPIQVLCVGDSYTQGVGASELKYSYPMQLQECLRQKSPLSWIVINCGKAGTNSSELVHYIPKLFEEYSPRYLCVLIGINDSWNFECRDTKEQNVLKTTGVVPWRLRCRTYRLFCMMSKYIKDIQVTKLSLDEKKCTEPRTRPFKERKIEENLSVEQLNTLGNELFKAGRFSEAIETLKKIVRQYPQYNNLVSIEIKLANALAEQKQMEDAFVYACSAQKRIADQASQCHNALAWLFMRLCKFELAYNEIEQYKRFFPDNLAPINKLLGNYYFETYHYQEAEGYFLKALEYNPQDAFAMRTIARIYSFDEKKLLDAKKMLMRAYVIDKNKNITELYLGIVHSSAWRKFQEILNQTTAIPEMDQQTYDEFLKISKEFARRQGETELLQANLSTIVSLCSKYNVTLLLMTYPSHKDINGSIRKFCADHAIMMLDLEKVFKSLLQDKAHDTYFVIDSHLNNLGYMVMAQKVGDSLMAHEAKSDNMDK